MPTMTIPEVRDELRRLARDTKTPAKLCERLSRLADELTRRAPTRRARQTSTPLTPTVAAHIRHVARLHPEWSQQRIAETVGVNPGRVSEALRGKRGDR